jgi:hypothetical protein
MASVMGTPETLVARMVGFLFHYRDILRDMAGGTPIATYIGFDAPNGAAVWQALADTADAAKYGRPYGHIPSPPARHPQRRPRRQALA